MTTSVIGTGILFNDGTLQTSAARSAPAASESQPGTVIYAMPTEAQDKNNDWKYLTNDSFAQGGVAGAGGLGQNWINVTGSRVANVAYLNDTGRGIMVNLTSHASGNYTYAGLVVNGVEVNYTGGDQDGGGATVMASAMVPPGQWYHATTGFSAWFELR